MIRQRFLIPISHGLCVTTLIVFVIAVDSLRAGESIITNSPSASLSRIGSQSWLSGGTGVVSNRGLSASFTNPAALSLNDPEISLEMGYQTKASWLYNDISYNGTVIPTFVSAGIPVFGFSLSISYACLYSQRLEYSPTIIRTESNPDGNGEYVTPIFIRDIHSFAVSLRYPLFSWCAIGTTLGLNHAHLNDSWGLISNHGTGYGALVIGGIFLSPLNSVNAGATIRYTSQIDMDMNWMPVSNRGNYVLAYPKYVAQLPLTVEAGCSWQPDPAIQLSASYEFQNWKDLSAGTNEYNNTENLHLGAAIRLQPILMLRAGYCTQHDPLSPETDQKFITAGIDITMGRLNFTFGVMDSHPFKNPESTYPYWHFVPFHQTSFVTSFSYRFSKFLE